MFIYLNSLKFVMVLLLIFLRLGVLVKGYYKFELRDLVLFFIWVGVIFVGFFGLL